MRYLQHKLIILLLDRHQLIHHAHLQWPAHQTLALTVREHGLSFTGHVCNVKQRALQHS